MIRSTLIALLAGAAVGIGVGALIFRGDGENAALAHLGTQGVLESKGSTPENTAERGADDLAFSKADPASADWREAAQVIRGYYAAGAAEDGARGCELLYSLFAEEITEVYGQPPGPAELRGRSCAEVMNKLFHQEHSKFAYDHSHLRVTLIRVSGLRGLAVMKFGDEPERDIRLHREHGTWKIAALLDTEMS